MEKCKVTQIKSNISKRLAALAKLRIIRRCSSTDRLDTSPVGAVTSLILLLACTVVASGLLGTNNTFATASTLSLTVDNSTVDVNLIANSAAGSFAKSSNTTITAATNNITGYTLSVAASSSTNYDRLINSDNTACNNTGESSYSNTGTVSSNCFTSIKDPTPESAFKALSGTGYNNLWGYLPSKYCTDGTCTTNTDFRPAPKASGDIIDKTTAANTTPNEYTLAIGARVDSSVKMGSYSNTYNVILVGNEIPYSITYDDNVVSNMPTDTSGASPDTTVAIDTKVPVRSGYKFLGWCTVQPTNNNGTDVCTGGTTYAAGASYTLDQTGSNTITLTAMWKESTTFDKAFAAAGKSKYNNYYKMQDATDAICSAVDEGETSTLIDVRGSTTTYTVAKLKDGKCWMTSNLNLAGGTALSADDTDVTSAYISSFSTSNNLTKSGNTIVLPASSTSGFYSNNYSYVYNSGSTTCAGQSPCYSYYSWDAATLGSGRSISTNNTDAEQSICPKGWRLPTSRTTGATNWQTTSDFYALAHQYGLDSTTSTSEYGDGFYTQAGPGTTPNFLLAGSYGSGSFYDGGSLGYYWSSTSYSNANNARDLDFNSGSVYSADYLNRYFGFSVRCVFGS